MKKNYARILILAFILAFAPAAAGMGSANVVRAAPVLNGLARTSDAPSDAAIVINVTVGMDPTSCAVEDSITLPPGGAEAVFCFEVTNSGDVTLTRHTLTDNFGTILNDFPYALVPGASAFITNTVFIDSPTTNEATWYAYNPGPIDEVQSTGSATVAIGVSDIELTMTVGIDPTSCATDDSITLPPGGGTVTLCYSVLNTGDVTLTRHTLVDDHVGVILNDFPYALVPAASAFITQTLTVNSSLTSEATWTAFNPGPIDEAVSTDSVLVQVEGFSLYLPTIER